MTTISRSVVGLGARGVLLAVSLLLLPGCLGEAFMIARAVKRSGKGPFYHQINDMLEVRDAPPDLYSGRLPRNLEKFSDGDKRFKSEAAPYNRLGTPKFHFAGVQGDRICFFQTKAEEVIAFHQEEFDRVEGVLRAYDFAVEFHGPLDDPSLLKRDVWPTDTPFTMLDSAELTRMDEHRRPYPKDGQRELFVVAQLLRCGPMPKGLNENSRMLTVAVRPHYGVELSTDPYVLMWTLTDDEGRGTAKDPGAVASKDE